MSAETFETATPPASTVEQLRVEPAAPVVDESAPAAVDAEQGERESPADDGFDSDLVHHGQVGSALVFALLAAMGAVLAFFATPMPVVIAGWVFLVAGGVLAFRQLAGGEAR